MPISLLRPLLACLPALLFSPLFGEEGEAGQLYRERIKPLLKERCYACHGALKQQAGLRLDTVELILKGGDDGPVVTPGKRHGNRLLERLTHPDPEERMPPEAEPLKPEEILAIRDWIAAGAPVLAGETGDLDPDRHWAFQRIEKPAVPGVEGVSHPIDAFLAVRQEERSLVPQVEADRPLLLRRLYLDLVGLPPTPEQQSDGRPWEVIVEELLASPHHGERWARHWMDVWRYADGYGLGQQLRYSQKHLWHWRDWIVESINEDKGYDRMILEMLAADEIAPEDPSALRATGFLARNYFLFNRTTWLDNTIEHTGKAFFGLTLNCAKCHDHKYDPVSQEDYYRFRAIFEPHQVRLDPVPGEVDFEKNGLPRAFDHHLDEPTYLHLRGDPGQPDESAILSPGVPLAFSGFAPEIEPVALPVSAYAPGARDYVQRDRLTAAEALVEKQRDVVAKAHEDAKAAEGEANPAESGTDAAAESTGAVKKADAALAAAVAEREALRATVAADRVRFSGAEGDAAQLAAKAARLQAEAELARARSDILLHQEGDNKKKAAASKALTEAEEKLAAIQSGKGSYTPLAGSRKALETPEHDLADYPPVYPEVSSGRRSMLAQWIVSRENPLTARVAVNHVWMRHFGEPLVGTVFDFGRQASEPEHLLLLDYLAATFIESGWSFRELHRLMTTSLAYRRSSSNAGSDPSTYAADPENRYYWRMNPRRMEAQVVRDSLLGLAGKLDRSLGGPSLDPAKGGYRRSLYFTSSPAQSSLFLSMFDDADFQQCYRRSESIVPQQALALANSAVTFEAAERLAGTLADSENSGGGLDGFIVLAFETILARSPDASEIAECRQFFEEWDSISSDPGSLDSLHRARTQLVHSLFNHNDFITMR